MTNPYVKQPAEGDAFVGRDQYYKKLQKLESFFIEYSAKKELERRLDSQIPWEEHLKARDEYKR